MTRSQPIIFIAVTAVYQVMKTLKYIIRYTLQYRCFTTEKRKQLKLQAGAYCMLSCLPATTTFCHRLRHHLLVLEHVEAECIH